MTDQEMDDLITSIRASSIKPLKILAEADLPEWTLFEQWEIEGLCERILRKLRDSSPSAGSE